MYAKFIIKNLNIEISLFQNSNFSQKKSFVSKIMTAALEKLWQLQLCNSHINVGGD